MQGERDGIGKKSRSMPWAHKLSGASFPPSHESWLRQNAAFFINHANGRAFAQTDDAALIRPVIDRLQERPGLSA
jgi:hypothetical protein